MSYFKVPYGSSYVERLTWEQELLDQNRQVRNALNEGDHHMFQDALDAYYDMVVDTLGVGDETFDKQIKDLEGKWGRIYDIRMSEWTRSKTHAVCADVLSKPSNQMPINLLRKKWRIINSLLSRKGLLFTPKKEGVF